MFSQTVTLLINCPSVCPVRPPCEFMTHGVASHGTTTALTRRPSKVHIPKTNVVIIISGSGSSSIIVTSAFTRGGAMRSEMGAQSDKHKHTHTQTLACHMCVCVCAGLYVISKCGSRFVGNLSPVSRSPGTHTHAQPALRVGHDISLQFIGVVHAAFARERTRNGGVPFVLCMAVQI